MVAVALVVPAAVAGAQLRPEARLEGVTAGSGHHAEAGLGFNAPLGPYLRAGIAASGDVWNESGSRRGRVEGEVRFLLDPIAENRWALSFAGGLGVRDRPYLLLAADLEGPRRGGWRPAIRLALGGGARAGLIMRGARPNRR